MFINTQDARKQVEAALCMRAQRQNRSWNWRWRRKKFTNVPGAEIERPWAGVAEWLRVAHSLLDDKTVELTGNAD